MIDRKTQKQLEDLIQDDRLRPQYRNLSFSNIPSAVQYLLGTEPSTPLSPLLDTIGITPMNTKKVVLFLLDGFGYRQWTRYVDRYSYLRRCTERGLVAPVTAVFPSTTSAALTTINSGLTPQEHGLLEWTVYMEELGYPINTLPFTSADPQDHGRSLASEVDPRILFDGKTLYEALSEHKIPSFAFTHAGITGTPYATISQRGASRIAHKNASDMLVNLRQMVKRVKGPAYFYVYWDLIDAISHLYGPHSEQYLAELNSLFHLMETEFVDKLDADTARDLTILMTADHGHININPEETLFLNDFPEVMNSLRTGVNGRKILPWGSSRDSFLAIEPNKIEQIYKFLTERLKGIALVLKSQEALASGLFGHGNLHPRFRSRIGDLMILPHENATVFFEYSAGGKMFSKRGMHGGLSPDEMLVPFACVQAERLIG